MDDLIAESICNALQSMNTTLDKINNNLNRIADVLEYGVDE